MKYQIFFQVMNFILAAVVLLQHTDQFSIWNFLWELWDSLDLASHDRSSLSAEFYWFYSGDYEIHKTNEYEFIYFGAYTYYVITL